MARLDQSFNLLNLKDQIYPVVQSRPSTISLIKTARSLYLQGLSVPQISKQFGKSHLRTKELITGVNKLPNSNEYKIIVSLNESLTASSGKSQRPHENLGL